MSRILTAQKKCSTLLCCCFRNNNDDFYYIYMSFESLVTHPKSVCSHTVHALFMCILYSSTFMHLYVHCTRFAFFWQCYFFHVIYCWCPFIQAFYIYLFIFFCVNHDRDVFSTSTDSKSRTGFDNREN